MSSLAQNTPEWLEFRRTRLGASDAPIIMGVSPWKTPYQLWEQKVGLKQNDAPNDAMRRGTEMEEQARKEFIKATGIDVKPSIKTSKQHEFIIASLDGIDHEEKNIVEIKCPGKNDHELALLDGVIPEKYFPQLQHQMYVTDLDMSYYFSYSPTSSKVLVMHRDDKYIAKMLEKEKEFYDCMTQFIAPKLTERDYVERSDEEWKRQSTLYLEIQKQLNSLELQEKEIREKLIHLAGGSNAKDSNVRLSKIVRKGNVDYTKIPELKEVNLEAYRKPAVESWRINVG